MALITQSSDPVLWAKLEASYQSNPAAYVLYGDIHYTVHQTTGGDRGFVAKTNEELFDSRSLTRSKAASYRKLDGDV